ncbi:hypothetical protein [Streptomyces sp. NPDC002845]
MITRAHQYGRDRAVRRCRLVENCPACGELDRLCRYHEGYTTGYEALNQLLTEASRVDPKVTIKDALRRLADADEAAERGELAAAVDRLTRGQGRR